MIILNRVNAAPKQKRNYQLGNFQLWHTSAESLRCSLATLENSSKINTSKLVKGSEHTLGQLFFSTFSPPDASGPYAMLTVCFGNWLRLAVVFLVLGVEVEAVRKGPVVKSTKAFASGLHFRGYDLVTVTTKTTFEEEAFVSVPGCPTSDGNTGAFFFQLFFCFCWSCCWSLEFFWLYFSARWSLCFGFSDLFSWSGH